MASIERTSTVSSVTTDANDTVPLFLKDIDGESRLMRVTPDTTVKQFQKMVKAKTGIRRGKQQLSFAGRNIESAPHGLKDTSPALLQTYGMQPGSTVELNGRLKGGCLALPCGDGGCCCVICI
eukprot:TRINITY_DN112831_c0_g1_i2.p1 TRINITY_DN112831_c0_g1~~TRINITY_DN112831_c0_g1_i2.p1  ORF type:complete len:123 (+),score=9.99 TRINITY_DN112831_c0_g1_i2:43-411(+)